MATGLDVVREARKCIGAPFKHQGRSPLNGLDCVGLVIYCGRQLGYHGIVELPAYSPQPNMAALDAVIAKSDLIPVSLDSLEPGDIIRIAFNGYPSHFAIYTGSTIVHAVSSRQFVVEHRYSGLYKKATVAAYRMPLN